MGDQNGIGSGSGSGSLGEEGNSLNYFDNNLQETEYYTCERLKAILQEKRDNDITLIHANIVSLPYNLYDFNNRLALLDFVPDIIAFSETKITSRVNAYYKPHIDGYEFYKSESSTCAGSVGVFVKDDLIVNERPDLDISVPGLIETVWFDIEQKVHGKKLTIGVFYRHHGLTDIPYFERRLEAVMTKLNASNANYYLVGDFNVNSLLYDEEDNIKCFVDMMHANSAVNLINKPTRFPRGRQWGAPSLLDHFYTNNLNSIRNIGLFSTDISDHMPIVSTINMGAKKNMR